MALTEHNMTTSREASSSLCPCVALVHFCDDHGPVAILCTRRAVDRDHIPASIPAPRQPRCEACHSLDEGQRSIVSGGEAGDEVFFSSNVGSGDGGPLEETLKRMALRSLSFEASSSPEGVDGTDTMIFSSSDTQSQPSMFALSSTFRVKDAGNVRGFKRAYGILVLLNHRHTLLQLAGKMTEVTQSLVAQIQVSALQKFEEEAPDMAATARGRSLPVPNSAAAVALRPRPPPPSPSNVAHSKGRNLVQLTHPDIYLVVHRHFASLLRMVYYSCKELRLPEGARKSSKLPLTREEASALGSIGLCGLVKVLSSMARGSKVIVRGKDRDRVSNISRALLKLTTNKQQLSNQEVPFMDPKNGGAVYYEQTLPGSTKSKESHLVDLTSKTYNNGARDFVHRSSPAVVALAEALVASARGEVSERLADVLVQSKGHEYLTVATIAQGHLAAPNRTAQPQFFASVDVQRLCNPS